MVLLVWLSLLLFVLASCSGEVRDFGFTINNEKTITVLEKPDAGPGSEGRLIESRDGRVRRETPLYTLKEPVTVISEDSAFSLTYLSEVSPLFLVIFPPGDEKAGRFMLPTTWGEYIDIRIPVEKGLGIKSFKLETDTEEGEVLIKGAGIGDFYQGISFEAHPTVKGMGVDFRLRGDNKPGCYLDFSGLKVEEKEGIMLEYDYMPDKIIPEEEINPKVLITINEDLRTSVFPEGKRFSLNPARGRNKVYFYPASCGFPPQTLDVEFLDTSFKILSVRVLSSKDSSLLHDNSGNSEYLALPADFGAILNYESSEWRDESFEIFSWTLFPDILIMDTKDYQIQSRFFKRLAFFVEKHGYTGKIHDYKELEGIHGWNAHDYRAEDLARFFITADKEEIALLPEEKILKNILLQNGVLEYGDRGIRPGAGGILSISRSSSSPQRHLLLSHEGYHGIFFSLDSFRNSCFTLWDNLESWQKEIWKEFLRWFGYNIEDEYLVVNELQAYLLQQPTEEADRYFRSHPAMSTSLRSSSTDKTPTFLSSSAFELNKVLYELTGMRAGNLLNLIPID